MISKKLMELFYPKEQNGAKGGITGLDKSGNGSRMKLRILKTAVMHPCGLNETGKIQPQEIKKWFFKKISEWKKTGCATGAAAGYEA